MGNDWSSMLGTLIGLLCGGSFILVFLGGGIYLIYVSLSSRRKVQISQQWPSMDGRILDAKIVQVSSTDSDGDTTYSYHLAVQYEYEVNGQRYVNDKRTLGPVQKRVNPRRSQETLDRYPVGGIVPVYYNPENPQEAVLEREASLTNLTLIIGVIIALVFGCMGCSILCVLSRMLPDLITGGAN